MKKASSIIFNKEHLTFYNIVTSSLKVVTALLVLTGAGNIYKSFEFKKNKVTELSLSLDKAKAELSNNKKINETQGQDIADGAKYYISSIYAYAILNKHSIEILQKVRKYNGYTTLEIVFKRPIDKAQMTAFATDVRNLGFVEKIEKNKIFIQVQNKSVNDIRKIVSEKHKLPVEEI